MSQGGLKLRHTGTLLSHKQEEAGFGPPPSWATGCPAATPRVVGVGPLRFLTKTHKRSSGSAPGLSQHCPQVDLQWGRKGGCRERTLQPAPPVPRPLRPWVSLDKHMVASVSTPTPGACEGTAAVPSFSTCGGGGLMYQG